MWKALRKKKKKHEGYVCQPRQRDRQRNKTRTCIRSGNRQVCANQKIMQKEIHKEDYFGTLMSILVDESRRMMPTFNPTPELHKIQNDMCREGTWIDDVPVGTIIETVPQESIQKLQADVLPGYRRSAANLIDRFISEFEAQGGRRVEITEKFERMYKWKQ